MLLFLRHPGQINPHQQREGADQARGSEGQNKRHLHADENRPMPRDLANDSSAMHYIVVSAAFWVCGAEDRASLLRQGPPFTAARRSTLRFRDLLRHVSVCALPHRILRCSGLAPTNTR